MSVPVTAFVTVGWLHSSGVVLEFLVSYIFSCYFFLKTSLMAFFTGSGLPSGVSLLAKLALGEVNYACIPDVFSGLVYSCDVEPRMTVIFVVLEELMAAASACAIAMLIVIGASAVGATLVPIKAPSALALITGLPSLPME